MASPAPTPVPVEVGTTMPSVMPTMAPTAPTLTLAARRMDHFVESEFAIFIALACAMLAIWISLYNIFKHLVNYTEPVLQKNIIRILFMVTFYALFSFLSLCFPSAELYLDSIRDIYEAFVVYCFLNLMLMYCGGENSCLSVIMHDPGAISHVWPFSYCLPHIAMNARFLRVCKQWTLQFVIVKPIMAVLNLILIGTDGVNQDAWSIFQAVVYNVSYTAALYALVLFYKATHNHPGLKSQYPVLKFLSVKLVVFATYYQSFLVSVIPDVPEQTLESFNSFLLCCEMVFFALLHFWAFNYHEFTSSGASKRAHIASRRDSAFDDIGIDLPTRISPGGDGVSPSGSDGPGTISDKDTAFQNARNVINLKDVASDTYINFSHKYGDHVLLDTTGRSAGTSMLEDDMSPDADNTSMGTGAKATSAPSSTSSRFGLGRIGTTMRSLATGGRVGGTDDDDLEANANPFEVNFGPKSTATPPPAPGAFGSSDHQSNFHNSSHQSQQHSDHVDFSLPTYPSSDHDSPSTLENPFEQDLRNPLRTSVHQNDNNDDDFNEFDSQHDGAGALGDNDGDWTADFSDPTPSADKNKKKKKKKKKQATGDELQLA
mmetsp:Transcript_3352/g.7503  ORF Transcript_3352/g.7503 Transcript_3352/m.7503 type:complete len:601 (+) Transcript_3352:261-2063(+)